MGEKSGDFIPVKLGKNPQRLGKIQYLYKCLIISWLDNLKVFKVFFNSKNSWFFA
jgi:hypothetical protein